METIEKIETEELILNAQPEFVEGSSESVPAQYFILLEDNQDVSDMVGQNVYGAKVIDWVQRACFGKAVILKVNDDDEIISLIRPYLNGAEYSVVLYANTPLVTKKHIADLLGFVQRKRMNVCKLKRGYVFKNEFIERADEFFSIDTYNFASNDFFEVKNLNDLEFAKKEIKKRLLDYLKNNGVVIETSETLTIDATSQIDYSTRLFGGVSVLGNSKIGTNCVISSNAVIKNSKLSDDVEIGENAIIEGSVIKSGTKIEAGAIVKGSVIGKNCEIKLGSKIVRSALKENVKIGECSFVSDSKLGTNSEIGEAVVLSKSSVYDGASIESFEKIKEKLVEDKSNSEINLSEEE